jgi:hypothetical protein
MDMLKVYSLCSADIPANSPFSLIHATSARFFAWDKTLHFFFFFLSFSLYTPSNKHKKTKTENKNNRDELSARKEARVRR